ncbi:MAG TPA: PaaI family thioesterase [Candidatus Limnocylindrales bacterium]|nr:PaaI family thioesterase [Candidatus Limnocylindrales bacterium]
MTSERAVRVGSGVPRFELAPHNCFACGTLNEHGLRLVLHVEPGRSWTDVTLDRRFEGWEGIAHGGIACTILDEVMAWALVGADNWGLTARLSVEYRRPIQIGRPVRAEGWITRSRRRVVETAGRITDTTSGAILAEGTATYVAADEARKQAMRERYGFRLVEQPPSGRADSGDAMATTT